MSGIDSSLDKHPYLKEVQPNSLGFIGNSSPMIEVYETIQQVGPKNVTVNIVGESGTGKELVAKALHGLSGRSNFAAVNCGAFPEGVLESWLFGVERGVATGVEKRTGLMEYSSGGTIFLDEISDMPLKMQVDLLRVLQEREIVRVGGSFHEAIPVDLRIITAASQSLEECVAKNKFRDDLYYRLAVVPIELPALRDRGEDVSSLSKYFCGIFSDKHKIRVYLADDALDFLKNYNWPGNVRELENRIERAVVTYSGKDEGELHADTFKVAQKLLDGSDRYWLDYAKPGLTFHEAIALARAAIIKNSLIVCGGNVSQAARYLGMERRHLRKTVRGYGIDPKEYRRK